MEVRISNLFEKEVEDKIPISCNNNYDENRKWIYVPSIDDVSQLEQVFLVENLKNEKALENNHGGWVEMEMAKFGPSKSKIFNKPNPVHCIPVPWGTTSCLGD